jgi:hypothetical protein
MTDQDAWSKILQLVPKERLEQKNNAPDVALAELEQRTLAQFNAEAQEHSLRSDQVLQATRRPVWEPPAPPQDYLPLIEGKRQWLLRCASFDAVAEQLRVRGRPAFAARLKSEKDDTEKALAICNSMALGAGATLQAGAKIAADSNKEITQRMLDMNRETQKVYDAANKKWLKR